MRKPSAGIVGAPTLHDYGTVTTAQTIDPSTADVHLMTLGANLAVTFSTFSVPDRTVMRLFVTQDATGSRTVSSWTGVTWLNGITPTLRTTASAYDLFEFTYVSSLTTWVGRYLTLYALDVASLGLNSPATSAANFNRLVTIRRNGVVTGYIALDASDSLAFLDATGANANLTITDAGAELVRGTVDVQGASGFALGAIAGRRRLQSTGAEGFNLLGDSNAYASLELLFLAAGTTPATSGKLRVPNGTTNGLRARNAADSADIGLAEVLLSNIAEYGNGAASIKLSADTDVAGTVKVGSGTRATAGDVNLNNAGNVKFRNAANSADMNLVSVQGTDECWLGNGSTKAKLSGSTVVLGASGQTLSFFDAAGTTKPTITGSRGGNAALASLLTALANLGLLTDSTTA